MKIVSDLYCHINRYCSNGKIGSSKRIHTIIETLQRRNEQYGNEYTEKKINKVPSENGSLLGFLSSIKLVNIS